MTLHFFAKPDTPNNEAIQAFFNNFDLIQQHKEEIYANPEYYNIFIQGCGAFPLYVQPIRLSIGELLKLWDETSWQQDGKYFYCVTGSPLSGSNSSKYWSKEDDFSYTSTKTFGNQIRSALWLLQTGQTEVKSRCTPIEVPNREPSKLTVTDLINVLNSLPPDTTNIC